MALHEGIGGFVVDGSECRDVADEFVQEGGFDEVRLLRDEGFLSQDHLLCRCRVCRQQPPVDVATVSQVRIVTVLRESNAKHSNLYRAPPTLGCSEDINLCPWQLCSRNANIISTSN